MAGISSERPGPGETGREAVAGSSSAPWILLTTILGSSMVFIDGTVVNIALPAIESELGADALGLQWIYESYALTLASFLLIGGALSDRAGRRRIFVIGALLFGVASAVCAVAPTTATLVAARALQGFAGALLAPTSLAILTASFSGEARGRAIGTWSAAGALTMILGPLLGGFLVEHASWRWAFAINPPIAALVAALALRHVPESKDETATGKLDLPGAGLAVVALGALTYGLVTAGATGFGDTRVWVALAVGVMASVAFLQVERTRKDPMVPLGIFRSPVFAGTNLLTFLLYGALSGLLFFVPLNLIQVQGYGATAAGATMLPLAISLTLFSRWAGGLSVRFGPRLPLVIGPAVTGLGFALFALPDRGGPYVTTFLPPMLFVGLGMAIAVAPLTTAVMGALPPRHAGLASGVNNAVSRTAGVLAIAAFGAVMLLVFEAALAGELGRVAAPASALAAVRAQSTRLAGIELPAGLAADTAAALHDAVARAFVHGFRILAYAGAAVAWASSLVAAVTLRKR